jgi:hypothetical protein
LHLLHSRFLQACTLYRLLSRWAVLSVFWLFCDNLNRCLLRLLQLGNLTYTWLFHWCLLKLIHPVFVKLTRFGFFLLYSKLFCKLHSMDSYLK